MTTIDRATLTSYANNFNTAGNPEAAASAAREIARSKGIELSGADFAALRDALVNFNPADPAEGLRLPGEFRGADGSSLDMESTQISSDIYSCMALFQKLAQQMRDTARTQRHSEMEAAFKARMDAADKMVIAANARFEAAQAEAIGEIVAGSIGVVGSVASLGPKTEQGSRAVSGVSDGLGKIAMGSAKTWANEERRTADKADADKARFEAAAGRHDTLSQQASDMMQQTMDVIRDVRDTMRSMDQAAIETNKGIAKNV